MQKEMLFFDAYIAYSSDQGDQLYPVPVLVTNYVSPNGDTVNTNSDNADWVLTRRFWLVDTALFPGPERRECIDSTCSIMRMRCFGNRRLCMMPSPVWLDDLHVLWSTILST